MYKGGAIHAYHQLCLTVLVQLYSRVARLVARKFIDHRWSTFQLSLVGASVMPPTSPYAMPQTVEKIGPAAGHTPFRASWTASLARSGQTQTWRAANTSQQLRMPSSVQNRPSWDSRHPVWEKRIPQWSPEATYLRSPAQRFGRAPPPKRGFNPSLSETSSTVARSVRGEARAQNSPSLAPPLRRTRASYPV